jgi:HK97 gp10 family phage protein
MAKNVSLERFKKLTDDLKTEVRIECLTGTAEQAESMAETMRSVVPVGKTGALKASIRVEPGRFPGQVLIKAGGPTTTKQVRQGSGNATYDYALAQEFGTHEHGAQPFFWPSYRLKKKRARRAIKSRITRAIKKRSAE